MSAETILGVYRARDYGGFQPAVVQAIIAGGGTVLVAENQIVSSNYTVPANVTVAFIATGQLQPASGVTITINGHIEAGLSQIFGGAGTVVVAGNQPVYPDWFGAAGNGVTDDSAAINRALAASKVVAIAEKSYGCSNLTGQTGQTVYGTGPNSVLQVVGAATNTMFGFYTGADIEVRNLMIDGGGYNFDEGLLRFDNVTRGRIHHNQFRNAQGGTSGTSLSVDLSASIATEYIDVSHNIINDAPGIGIGASGDHTSYISVSDNLINGCTSTPIGGQATHYVIRGNVINGGNPVTALLGLGIDTGNTNGQANGVIEGNLIRKATIYGQDIAGNLVVANNTILNENANINGICFIAPNATQPGALVVTGNRIDGAGDGANGDAALQVGRPGDTAGWSSTVVANNVVSNSQAGGIEVDDANYAIIKGNSVANSGQATSNNYSDIVVGNTSMASPLIEGNTCSSTTTNVPAYNIYIGSGVTNGMLVNNNFSGAARSAVDNAATSMARISGNQGYNPVGYLATQPAVPASGTAYTNTSGLDCMVYTAGGTVTAIALGGHDIATAQSPVRVGPGETITLTYSAAPTWTWFGD